MANFKVNTDVKYKAEVFVEPNDFVKAITSDGRVLDIGRYDVSNTLFVDAGATPNTGIRGMATKPYNDIHDAVADAQPGDLVFVHTGEYTLKAEDGPGAISKANIHIHFMPGTIVNYGYTPFNTTSQSIGAGDGYFYCTGDAQFRARSDLMAFNRIINMNAVNLSSGDKVRYYIECDSVDAMTALGADSALGLPEFVNDYIFFENSQTNIEFHLDFKVKRNIKCGARFMRYRTGTGPGKMELNIEVGESIIVDTSHGIPTVATTDVFLINGIANYFSVSCKNLQTTTENVIIDHLFSGPSSPETIFNFNFEEIRNLNSRLIRIDPGVLGSSAGRFIIRGSRIETSTTSPYPIALMGGPQKIVFDGPRLIGRNPLGPALIERNTNDGSLRLKNVYLQTESDFCITTNQPSAQIVCESIIGSNKPLGPNVTAVNPSVFLPDVSTSTPSVTGDFLLKTGDTMEGTIVLQVEEITPSPNIILDFGDKNNFEIILDQNITLQNPTNPTPGQSGRVVLIQDGTGNRTISFGSNWKFADNITPQLSTGANEVDMLVYEVIDTDFIAAQLINFSETGSSGGGGGDNVLLSTLDTRFVNITGDEMTGNFQISNNSWFRVRNSNNYSEVRDNLLQITHDGGLSWTRVENANGNLIITSTGGDIELQKSSGDIALRVDGATGDITIEDSLTVNSDILSVGGELILRDEDQFLSTPTKLNLLNLSFSSGFTNFWERDISVGSIPYITLERDTTLSDYINFHGNVRVDNLAGGNTNEIVTVTSDGVLEKSGITIADISGGPTSSPVYLRATDTSGQVVSSTFGITDDLIFGTVAVDTNSAWNGTEFTVPEDGVYTIVIQVLFGGPVSPVGRNSIRMIVDGNNVESSFPSEDPFYFRGTFVRQLTSGQIVRFITTCTGTRVITTSDGLNMLSIGKN